MLRSLTDPETSTMPAQHSGRAGQRAAATRTEAAGHPAITVGMPNTFGALPVVWLP
jgi:hypothetical protein